MVEMTAVYTGEKHCDVVHGPSQAKIETDAPRDNQGRGEAFSPTDLIGASLASCILTTIAIVAERDGINVKGMRARVTKEMNPQPRRIARLPVEITMPKGVALDDRKRFEVMAETCPVKRSLSPDVDTKITFIYQD